jgi:hypothetical protein
MQINGVKPLKLLIHEYLMVITSLCSEVESSCLMHNMGNLACLSIQYSDGTGHSGSVKSALRMKCIKQDQQLQ